MERAREARAFELMASSTHVDGGVRIQVMGRSTVRLLAAGLALVAAAGSLGCNRGVDPATVLEAGDVVTGWFDVGIEDGKNKLVPSISLTLRNKASRPIRSVQINAIFRRVNEPEMWGEHFGWAVGRDPLGPGHTTRELVLRSTLGYTSEESRSKMLQNREFVDAKVEIFLRQGSQVWAKLAEFPIERKLLTQ
jgi:hypothetical protein